MFSNEAMRAVEMLALVPFGNVVYYAAGRGAQVAAKGLKFANGVQTSPQGDLVRSMFTVISVSLVLFVPHLCAS